MSDFIYLSYFLSDSLTAYGNGKRILVEKSKSIINGDSSNNSFLSFSSHLGTHIDYQYHFCQKGKKSSDYNVDDHIFNNVAVVEIDLLDSDILLINEEMLPLASLNKEIDFLIIKTGFSNVRYEDRYWNFNPGIHPSLAEKLNNKFPKLKAIGFDSISLSSYQHREIGREAHKEFLCKYGYLIIEDMDLTKVKSDIQIKRLIIAPLLIKEIDGVPVTVIAEINNND